MCILIDRANNWNLNTTSDSGGLSATASKCDPIESPSFFINLLLHTDGMCLLIKSSDFHAWLYGMWEYIPSGRNRMAAILQTAFSNSFSCMKIVVFRFKSHWVLLPSLELPKSSVGLDNGVTPNCQQIIIYKVVGGYIVFTPSVHPSVHLSVRPSVPPAVSAL